MALAGLGMLVVMGGLLVLVAGRVPGGPKVAAALIIAGLGTVGVLVYLALARVLRVTEVTEVLGVLRRRLR
jgi:hypothetical protein